MGKYEGVDYYQQFLGFCVEAYNMLRKSSHLILNLLLLMVDSNIPQLTGEKELLEVEKN